MDELQYLAILAARKTVNDLIDETLHPSRVGRTVPSERRWRRWRRQLTRTQRLSRAPVRTASRVCRTTSAPLIEGEGV
jgi:hypothetical protein